MPRTPRFHFTAGTLVAERYRLWRCLGAGGFGEVWKARDKLSRSFVALKLLTKYTDRNPILFWTELSILRAHRVDGIVHLLDEGLWMGRPYLVMELVDGRPFPGRLSNPKDIISTTASLLEILGRVHAEGVLHQDIKPENVLVNDLGEPTLLDFGIASDVSMDFSGDPQKLYGVYEYIAPERLRGYPATLQSDLYSVGVLLFRALAGVFPFQHSETIKLLRACAHEPAPSLRAFNLNIPKNVVEVVDSLLSKDPAGRPASAADAADMLRGRPKDRTTIAEWLRSHGMVVPGPLVSQAALEHLFAGTERLFHIPSRAASLLYRRTLGDPVLIASEIRSWLAKGARFERDKLIVGKTLIYSLDSKAPKSASAEEKKSRAAMLRRIAQREERARHWIVDGPLSRAINELHDGLVELRSMIPKGRSKPDAALLALEERLLITWMDIALSDSTKQVLGPLQYELQQASPTPMIERLSRLADAAMATTAGSDKALKILNKLEAFEDIRLERRKHDIRAVACRRCSSKIEQRTFKEIDAWAKTQKQDDIMRARHAFWKGWKQYREGHYEEAAKLHLESSRLEHWRIARISARIAAASSLIETLCHQNDAISLARSALEEAPLCESPFIEARAEWVLRTALYRSGAALKPDLELVSAAKRLVGALDMEAQICFCEAAFAYRLGDSELCQKLALEAANAWLHPKSTQNRWLAQALAWACAEAKTEWTAVKPAYRTALCCKTPGIGIQTLALLNLGSATPLPLKDTDIKRLALQVPREYWDELLDILSVKEALGILERSLG